MYARSVVVVTSVALAAWRQRSVIGDSTMAGSAGTQPWWRGQRGYGSRQAAVVVAVVAMPTSIVLPTHCPLP